MTFIFEHGLVAWHQNTKVYSNNELSFYSSLITCFPLLEVLFHLLAGKVLHNKRCANFSRSNCILTSVLVLFHRGLLITFFDVHLS
jgi:hypothetical protein